MTNLNTPGQNHLLDALPADKYERLFSQLELVPMPLGEVLYETGEELRYVYFPTTSIVSKYCVMENGASTEIAVVGNEGIIGISLFMGGGTMPNRAVVRNEGYAYRLRRHLFIRALDCPDLGCHDKNVTVFVTTLHPGPNHPDGSVGGLQSASYLVPTTLPLAPAKPGPALIERDDHHTRNDCQYAWRPARRCHGSSPEITARGID